MLSIKLENVDELLSLSAELDILTYLLALIQTDESKGIIWEYDFRVASEIANEYLLEKQLIVATKLRELLLKKDFTISSKSNNNYE